MPDRRRGLAPGHAFELAVRAPLMPVLLAQALYLRNTVVTLPDPIGPRKTTKGEGPPLRFLVIGDSSALGIGVALQDDALLGQMTQRLAPHRTVSGELIAESGARTWDVVRWLDDLPDDRFDVVVTALGVNDVTKAVSLGRFCAGQATLIAGLKAKYGDPFVIASGLPPVHQFPLLPQPLRWVLGRQALRFDTHLRAIANAHDRCTGVQIDLALGPHNMAEDGFHPGPAVYAAWARGIVGLIAEHTDLLDGAETTA